MFDSLFLPGNFNPNPKRYHILWQHFKGWVIETEQPAFDPDLPTMFDFRTPQDGAMRFMYILPSSKHKALCERISDLQIKDLTSVRSVLADLPAAPA